MAKTCLPVMDIPIKYYAESVVKYLKVLTQIAVRWIEIG